MRYVGARLVHSLFLLIGVSLLSFVFAELAPGDFFAEIRMDPRVSAETVAALRTRHGLDQPFLSRYAAWVKSALRGELGFSVAYNSPVGPLLWPRIRSTLLLTATATVLAWLIAIPLGIRSATRRGSWDDRVLEGGISLLLAVPDLLLALGLLMLAVRTGYFPSGGMVSPGFSALSALGKLKDIAWHLILPVAALVLGTLPVLVRHVRTAMVEAIESPFARSARALGIRHRRLLFRHLLPAAANPLISLFGFSFGTLLSTSLLIEVVMGWPGLGPIFLDAIMARDFPLVLGVVMLSTMFLIAGNLIADILLYVMDPRIRMR